MLFGSVKRINQLVCTTHWPPSWSTKAVLQHGGSILSSMLQRIYQLWNKLGEPLSIIYNATIPQLDYCMAFDSLLCRHSLGSSSNLTLSRRSAEVKGTFLALYLLTSTSTFGRSWVQFLIGTQIFSLPHAHVRLISSKQIHIKICF